MTTAYVKYPLKFRVRGATDKAVFEVLASGDGCFVGTASLMPADNVRGLRSDTLALLKQLDAPMYRWPGGNFVSGYDWRDGIGDRDRRPPRRNPAWTGVEHNDFGLDEFIDFCREVKAEPLIAANTGFGDAYSAAQEVEYCNGGADTVGGAMRRENGQSTPYGVRYWCVGNEMFGPWQLGFMQLRHYTQKHNRFADAMWRADASIELIGVGDLGRINRKHDPDEKRGWSRGVLEQCGDKMQYLSEHFYCGRNEKDVVGHAALLADQIRRKADGHRKLQAELKRLDGRKVPIAMDEWNYWHRDYVYGELGCTYDLADALGVARGLHEYVRQSDIIGMAHYAQTVNVIGCIKTTRTQAFLSTTALPLMLYRKEFGTVPLNVSGTYALLNLDVVAAVSEDGKALTIGIVNPDAQARRLSVAVKGLRLGEEGVVSVIGGDDPRLRNDENQQPVTVQSRAAVLGDVLDVPALSISLYRFPVR